MTPATIRMNSKTLQLNERNQTQKDRNAPKSTETEGANWWLPEAGRPDCFMNMALYLGVRRATSK